MTKESVTSLLLLLLISFTHAITAVCCIFEELTLLTVTKVSSSKMHCTAVNSNGMWQFDFKLLFNFNAIYHCSLAFLTLKITNAIENVKAVKIQFVKSAMTCMNY